MLVSTTVMGKQFRMIETKDLGFSTQNRISIPFKSNHLRQSYDVFKDELRKLPGVINAAGSDKTPGASFSGNPVTVKDNPDRIIIARHEIDPHYMDLMKIKVTEGRGFDHELSTDTRNVLVNQAFIRQFGWDDPVGKRINRIQAEPIPYHVIGVVKDYHFKSLHEPIEPLIIYLKNYPGYFITVLLEDEGRKATLDRIRGVWETFFPGDPFIYNHLDTAYEPYYRSERNLRKVIHFFTVLIILISVLGLYGLVHLDTVSRTKEIGIKKVFGASSRNIVVYFIRQYGIYVGVACIFTFPATFLLMNHWLDTFNYRINILNPLLFITPALILFVVILIAISSQIIRIAQTNPIEALRHE